MTHRLHLASLALIVPLVACGDDGTGADTGSTGASTAASTTAGTSTAGTTSANTSMGTSAGSETGTASGSTGTATGTTDPTATGTTTGTTGTTGTTDPTTSAGTTAVTSTTSDTTTGTTGEPPCPKDTVLCENNTAKVCDGMGGFSSETPCADECLEGKGCVLCLPGSVQCNGKIPEVCNDGGDAWVPGSSCDDLQGLTCDPNQGGCAGSCANLGLSYVGCDYYAVTLQQHDSYNSSPKDDFAIAVANTSNQVAKVTVTRGANTVTTVDVPAASVQVITLPWVNELTKGQGPSLVVQDGSYRVRATNPVTVYQFNPLKSTTTNDASLLLPVNTWRDKYMIAAWPQWNSYPGIYAVVAKQDGTTVTLSPSNTGKSVKAGGGVAANGTGVITLNEGDVLEVFSSAGDLTGTIVSADKPIEAFGGHECTNVPLNIAACDHLEEAMFPVDTLAKEYVVTPPVQFPDTAKDKAQIIRVIASEAGTVLTFDPDQAVNKNLANAGDFVEFPMTQNAFKVSSDKKIMVAQYMVGQSANFGTSDPAMLLTVPTEQYRTDYLFYAATSWQANFVDIIAPKGASVKVDGVNVANWKGIGNSGFDIAHVQLANNGNGTHTVSGDQKVGISVYGLQSYGSYWYPGGLDLDLIPQ